MALLRLISSLGSERGLTANDLAGRVAEELQPERLFSGASEALNDALSSLGNQDIMLITGSFVTVEQCLLALSNRD